MVILLPILLVLLPAVLGDAEPQHPLLHHLHHQPHLLSHVQAAPSLVQHADGRYFAVNAHLQPGQLFQAADGRLFTLATSSLQEVSHAVEQEPSVEEEEDGGVIAVGRNTDEEEKEETGLVPLTSNSLNLQPQLSLFPNHPLAAVSAVPENSGIASSEAVTGSFQVIAPNRFRFPERLVPSLNTLASRESEASQNLPEPLVSASQEPLPRSEVDSPLPRSQPTPAQTDLKPFVHIGRPTELQPNPLRSLSPSPLQQSTGPLELSTGPLQLTTNHLQPAQLSTRINPLLLQQPNTLHQTTNLGRQFLPLTSTSPLIYSTPAGHSSSPLLLSTTGSTAAQQSPLLFSASPTSTTHLLSGSHTASSSPLLLSSSSASPTSPLILSQPNGAVYTGYYSFPSAGVNYNF